MTTIASPVLSQDQAGVGGDYVIPEDVWKSAQIWMFFFKQEWTGEIPIRIHSRDIDSGGAPEWHKDFYRWIERGTEERNNKYRRPEDDLTDYRLRTTKAFRKLRKKSPREYEVLYRTVILGNVGTIQDSGPLEATVAECAHWLTERAIRNDKPERYSPLMTKVILICAVDKVRSWW